MHEARYRLSALMIIFAAGSAFLWWGTDGFRAYTSETARRLAILHEPATLPAAALQDQDGYWFTLDNYHGRLVGIEFIYTRCQTICRSLGMLFHQLRERLPAEAFDHDVALLSISFDPRHDDTQALKQYGDTYGADGKQWRVARVPDEDELAQLLLAFGVVVIDDGLGGFEHNAALHLLGRDGRLRLIEDYDELDRFERTVRALL